MQAGDAPSRRSGRRRPSPIPTPSGARPTASRRPPASRRRPPPTRWASGIAGTVEEDLAEVDLAGDVAQRPDVDAGLVQVDQEVGDAAALGDVGVGPGEQHRVVGGEAPRGPDLLAGDDPLVAVELGPGGQRREVGSGARLAEELAPDLLVAHDRRQEAQPLLLGAVGEQRGRGVVAVPSGFSRPRLYGRSSASISRADAGVEVRDRRTPPATSATTRPERPKTGYQAS